MSCSFTGNKMANELWLIQELLFSMLLLIEDAQID